MSCLLILESFGTDRARWLDAWSAMGRDPFCHPDYVELVSSGIGKAQCAAYSSDGIDVLMPFIRRRVQSPTDSPFEELSDAISPYGYGGPYSSEPEVPAAFFGAMADYMHDVKLISFFGRVSLDIVLGAGPPEPRHRMVHMADNVIVSLRRSMEDQWRHYDRKVRKNVNKALRAGLHVEVNDSFTNLDDFVSLYQSTMERRSASSWYRFDRDFFARIEQSLANSMCVAEVHDSEGELVSAELVLRSDDHLYSYLGGTLSSAFPWGPNDLLKHAVITYGHAAELEGYVLGGGQAPGDGIFRYKKAFDPEGVRPFYGLQLVSDQTTYRRLTDARCLELSRREPALHTDSLFFPEYRAPGLET